MPEKICKPDQVCQSKHYIEFCKLFSQASIESLAKLEQLVLSKRNGAYGRLLMFPASDLRELFCITLGLQLGWGYTEQAL